MSEIRCNRLVGKRKEGIIMQNIFPHGHFVEPFAIRHMQKRCPVFVNDVDGAKRPTVCFDDFTMSPAAERALVKYT